MSEKTENDKSLDADLDKYYEGPNNEIMREMKDLMSGNRLKFLIGAGCSFDAGLPLMKDLTDEIVEKLKGNETMDLILQVFEGESPCSNSIERYMSAIVGYQSIIDKMKLSRVKDPSIIIHDDKKVTAEVLDNLLDNIKHEIFNIIEKRKVKICHHTQFIKGIHKHLFAGKKKKTVDYFVLNYDTLIEDALGLEEIRYQDGFEGSATGWWDPKLLKEQSDYSRVFKIHGSIDWCLLGEEDWTPKRIRGQIDTKKQSPVLIYPASTKYQEIQRNPFDTLITSMRNTLSESKQTVLVICGYSFNDLHINTVVEEAINVSEGKLTVMAFINDDEPTGQLKKWRNSPISDQVKVYANNGVFHGEGDGKGKGPFEWGKFETLSRLIGDEG